MLVKILGGIDLISSMVFLLLLFGIHPFAGLILFCAGLLFLKGMFIFTGDVLSIIDIIASISLLLSLLFMPPGILLWASSFLLLAKGVVSFV